MATPEDIKLTIKNHMPRHPVLVGCVRRNVWSGQSKQDWRRSRGVSLLALVGEMREVWHPDGAFDVHTYNDHLIVFRGGPWNTYWVKDIVDLWVITSQYFKWLSPTVYVLHEEKGTLDIKPIEMPAHEHATRYADIENRDPDADPPPRISKSTTHAVRVCRFCPHKTRCDALDTLRGDIQDYSPSYPKP